MVIVEKNKELACGFEYDHPDQGRCNATFIYMKAPSVKELRYLSKIKQFFTRALMQLQNSTKYQSSKESDSKENEKSADSELDASTVIGILESSNQDMQEFINYFRSLCTDSGLILIEGEVKFTDALLDKMTLEDFYDLMGEYVANFMVASLLK